MFSGTELSAVLFDQHLHLIFIHVILFFWGCLKDKIYNIVRRTKELKENIRREIANIPAEQNLFHPCEEYLRVEGQHLQHLLLPVNCLLLYSELHWPTGLLIHRQNSYAPRSRRSP
jgi:hypothetical protein